MENKKTNWGLVIGIIVATVAVLAAGAFLALKLLKKKGCCDKKKTYNFFHFFPPL